MAADLDCKNSAKDPAKYAIWAEGSTATDSVPEGWLPIGSIAAPFIGTFDGNGHTISNLYVNHPSISGVGLFGVLGSGAICNVGLEEVSMHGGEQCRQLGGGRIW